MAKQNGRKVVTDEVRASYVHLAEPFASFEGQDPKYSVVLLVPKSDTGTIQAIEAAQQAALEEGKSTKFNGTIPKNWKNTFRDGDDPENNENNPEYAGHMFMTVSNKRPVGVVDRQNRLLPAEDIPTTVYSGCYIRASLNAFPFNQAGNRGVSFGLNAVQKVRDGEPLGGMVRAEDEFGSLDDSDDNGDDLL